MLSLAADILLYMPEELDSLAQHIQTMGSELIGPIMQVYDVIFQLFFLESGTWNFTRL